MEDSTRSMAKKTSRKISMSSAVSQGDPRTEAIKFDHDYLDSQSSHSNKSKPQISVISQKETSPGVPSQFVEEEERDKEIFEFPDDSGRELLPTPNVKSPSPPIKKTVSFVEKKGKPNSTSQSSQDSLLGLLR